MCLKVSRLLMLLDLSDLYVLVFCQLKFQINVNVQFETWGNFIHLYSTCTCKCNQGKIILPSFTGKI